MSLLNLGYGLSGFMQGYDQQRLQSALLQQYANQLRQQQQQDQAASLLFPALLGGGAQTPMPGQPSVPQFGGGLTYGSGAPAPPAAAQPSSPPQFGGGPDLSSYGGAGVNFTGSPGAFIGANGGGGVSPFDTPPDMRHTVNPNWPDKDFGTGPPIMPSGPRVSASQYGGMAVDPSFGPVLARDPVPQVPRGASMGLAPTSQMASDASLLPEFSSGGSGQYTYDSSGNLIDQVTGSPVSSVSSRAATPTTDIPPAATAPSSPPGFSGSSAAAAPPLSAGDDSDSGGRRLPLSLGTGSDASTYGGSKADYIRQQAAKYPNINPNDAIRTVMSEGGTGRFLVGDAGTSGGPFQLHVGGGLGDKFQQQTGLNPLDPRNEKATIDWTLNYVSKNLGGKFPSDVWHGLRTAGSGGGGGGGAGLGGGGGGGANDAILQQAIGLIQKGMAPVPESLYGRMSTQQLARQIENANPNADPAVKMLALERGMKLLAPEDRLATQQYMQEHQDTFRVGLALLQSQLTQGRQEARQEGSGPIVTQDGKSYRVGSDNVLHPLKIEGDASGAPAAGVTKLGAAGSKASPLTDAAAERYAKIFAETGYLPPGIARSSAAIAQIMNKTGDVGTPGQFVANLATRQADTKSLANMTKIADAATSYENTAIRNFDQALKYSDKISTTELGPWLNKWVLSGETAAGDPTAPAYVVALLTAANEYAKVMSGGTGAAPSTEGSRREAYELFSPYLAKGQIQEVVKVAKREMENRREELYSGVDDIKSRLRSAGSDKPMSRGHEPGDTGQPSPSSGVPRVGDVVDGPDGKKYRVLTVKPDGQPDDVELAEPAQ